MKFFSWQDTAVKHSSVSVWRQCPCGKYMSHTLNCLSTDHQENLYIIRYLNDILHTNWKLRSLTQANDVLRGKFCGKLSISRNREKMRHQHGGCSCTANISTNVNFLNVLSPFKHPLWNWSIATIGCLVNTTNMVKVIQGWLTSKLCQYPGPPLWSHYWHLLKLLSINSDTIDCCFPVWVLPNCHLNHHFLTTQHW